MKSKKPTQGQFLDLWKNSKELEMDREMVEALKPEITALMKTRRDQILADRENIRTFELTATVQYDRDYTEALEIECPDTDIDENDVRKASDLYPAISSQEETVHFVFCNFRNNSGGWDKAFAWAETRSYKATNPYEVFSLVGDLKEVKSFQDCLYFVSTTKCTLRGHLRTVCIRLNGTESSAHLSWLESLARDDVWFVFRK